MDRVIDELRIAHFVKVLPDNDNHEASVVESFFVYCIVKDGIVVNIKNHEFYDYIGNDLSYDISINDCKNIYYLYEILLPTFDTMDELYFSILEQSVSDALLWYEEFKKDVESKKIVMLNRYRKKKVI